MSRESMDKNPSGQFEWWLNEALASDEKEPTAISFITIGTDGLPHPRIVLLKYFNEEGFIIFTHYNSDTGKAIVQNRFHHRIIYETGMFLQTQKGMNKIYESYMGQLVTT